jgi:Sortilin, neurotensin receptor 3,
VKSRFGLDPKTCSLCLAAGAMLLHAAPAAANGRFPQANQIVFSPTNPDLVVLRTTYGILPSHDHGATWQFLCEDALGVGPSALADPPLGLTQDDSLVAGVGLGLNVSPDTGCNWKCIGGPLAGEAIADLAVRPDAPSGAVAITRTYVPAPDSGQEVTHSQVFETNDNGVTWTAVGTPIDPTVVVETVDVSKTDPNRLYVSGARGFGATRTALLFMSKNKGTTWTEWRLPPGQFDPATEDSIFIGAVDPTNADRVYLRSSALPTSGQSRLTVVTFAADGTMTFVGPHVFDAGTAFLGLTGQMLGLALSEDGSKVYIGSVEDGLWRANASDLAFQKVSSLQVQCLATRGAELWACSSAVSGFVAGVSTDEGKTFTSKLPLIGTLTGPIACAPDPAGAACGQQSNASVCGAAYQSLCAAYTCQQPTVPGDAGSAGDASRADGSSHAVASSTSSSCGLAPGRGGAAAVGAAFALIGLAMQRRRRR